MACKCITIANELHIWKIIELDPSAKCISLCISKKCKPQISQEKQKGTQVIAGLSENAAVS